MTVRSVTRGLIVEVVGPERSMKNTILLIRYQSNLVIDPTRFGSRSEGWKTEYYSNKVIMYKVLAIRKGYIKWEGDSTGRGINKKRGFLQYHLVLVSEESSQK